MSFVFVVLYCFVAALSIGAGQPQIVTIEKQPFDLKKLLEERCSREYSATCFKADVAALVPPISSPRSFSLFPGLVLEMGGFHSAMPRTIATDLATIDKALDRYLVQGVDGFINSLALRVKVMDKSVVDVVRNMGISLAHEAQAPDTNATSPRDFTGRRRKMNQAIMMGGMVSAGTLLALTMSAISAMAGKAVLVSLISLAVSLLGGRSGGASSSGGTVSYEVVHSPSHNEEYFAKSIAQADAVGEAASHHLIKPLVSHFGGKRVGLVDIHL